ncbi:flavin reductase family protein [Nocardia sp. CA-084685]|uniref:flavin reductase family protein n=1 Tax=Nocardia sp. CA-084685 TaxID=3239970 RepID=UPI003D969657
MSPTGTPKIVSDKEIRDFHRKFVTGVSIVTTTAEDQPRGLAVNAFSSVTVSPAVVLICVAKTSSTHEVLFRADRFAVNLLAHDQLPVAKVFATKAADKFTGIDWYFGDFGNPVIAGACAYLEADITQRVRTSTHTVFFGSVLAACSTEAEPLVYAGGQFFDGAQLVPLGI